MGMTGGHRCLWTMVCLLHDLFCVTCPLHSNRGGGKTVTWGCEGTIAQRCILYKGGRGEGYSLVSFSDGYPFLPIACMHH